MPTRPKTHHPIPTPHRETACRRGYGRTHQKLRLVVLARDPLCKLCRYFRPGMPANPSTHADHIDPATRGREDLTIDDYQGACEYCNSRKRDQRLPDA